MKPRRQIDAWCSLSVSEPSMKLRDTGIGNSVLFAHRSNEDAEGKLLGSSSSKKACTRRQNPLGAGMGTYWSTIYKLSQA